PRRASSPGRRRPPRARLQRGQPTADASPRTNEWRGRAASMRPSQSRPEPRAAAEARSASLGFSLAVDAERSPGICLQPLLRDLTSSVDARAVRPVLDALQRGVDLGDDLLGVVAERVVDLSAEGRRRGLGEVVVARPGDLLDLVVERAGMLVAERRERVLDATPLVEKRVAKPLGVDARHRLSFLPRSSLWLEESAAEPPTPGRTALAGEARRRSISAGPIPVSSTIFSRPP